MQQQQPKKNKTKQNSTGLNKNTVHVIIKKENINLVTTLLCFKLQISHSS